MFNYLIYNHAIKRILDCLNIVRETVWVLLLQKWRWGEFVPHTSCPFRQSTLAEFSVIPLLKTIDIATYSKLAQCECVPSGIKWVSATYIGKMKSLEHSLWCFLCHCALTVPSLLDHQIRAMADQPFELTFAKAASKPTGFYSPINRNVSMPETKVWSGWTSSNIFSWSLHRIWIHSHQAPFTHSGDLNVVHWSQLEIMSNQIKLYYYSAFYVIKRVLRPWRPMGQHTEFISRSESTSRLLAWGLHISFKPLHVKA